MKCWQVAVDIATDTTETVDNTHTCEIFLRRYFLYLLHLLHTVSLTL